MTDLATDPPATPRRRFSAGDAIRLVLITAAVLVVVNGDSVTPAGEEMEPGLQRDVVTAVGGPTGWVADHLPFAAITDELTGWLSPDEDLGSDGEGFSTAGVGSGASRVPPQAFSAQQLGTRRAPRVLKSLLVTGDSMSQPLDATLARRLADKGVQTKRDPHIGTGISKPFVLDWGKLAVKQAREVRADAVVMFLGANEGFPMEVEGGEVECCGPDWAAEYATRARAMMEAYRRNGAAKVYWVLIPAARDRKSTAITRSVNAAIRVAAGAFGAQVEVVDSFSIFTPGGTFRTAMEIGGRSRIVRDPDGIHLNDEGADLLADLMLTSFERTFTNLGS